MTAKKPAKPAVPKPSRWVVVKPLTGKDGYGLPIGGIIRGAEDLWPGSDWDGLVKDGAVKEAT